MLCTNEVARGFEPGAHASTFGGNPFATRAGLAVFDVIERDGLIENAAKMGTYLNERLAALAGTTPGVLGARGRGLMQALVVDEAVDRAAIGAAARARGLLLTLAGHDALRLVPPLIVGKAHIDEAVELLADAVREVATS
ncbi:MAG: aminotransferase class III-fold pyridoxal phosphate-dependent enzyme, partial [Myxococcales bacterium]|nr:aminotransferase class III-fold pyridoxal phosphate-dependent enzyme [Myxococcales bacterium]